MEERVKKPRVSRAVNKGRERVKNVTLPVFDTQESSDWKIASSGDGIPTWWKYVPAPKVSKKERVKQMKSLRRSVEEKENAKARLEQKNAEYRQKLKEDAKRISDELLAKRAHVDAIMEEENRVAEIEKLNAELEIKRLEEERMRISAEEERLRLAEEEQNQLRIRDSKRTARQEKLRAKREEAELLAREEAERAERERIAREERQRILDEQLRTKEEMRAKKAEIERINYEEQLRRETERAEKERLLQIERDRENLKKLEQSKALLALEEQRVREENERIDAERKALAVREERLAQLREKAEAKRIRQERKSFRVPDFEYQPYPNEYPVQKEDCIVELYDVTVRDRNGYTVLSPKTLVVKSGKLTTLVVEESGEAEMMASVITRTLKKGEMVSKGEVRVRGINAIDVPVRVHRKDMQEHAFVVGMEDAVPSSATVEKYCSDHVREDKMPLLRDYLLRFNLIKKGFFKKKVSSLTEGERARVEIACALLSDAELTLMIDPQRALDAPSRLTLKELISEWRTGENKGALAVLTSDEGILPKRRGKNG